MRLSMQLPSMLAAFITSACYCAANIEVCVHYLVLRGAGQFRLGWVLSVDPCSIFLLYDDREL